MPKTLLDWMGVVSLWLGSLIMAINAGGIAAPPGAPSFFTSEIWSYVPLALFSVAMAAFVYRQIISPRLARSAPTSPAPTAPVPPPRVMTVTAAKPAKPAYRLADEQKRRLVELITPLQPLQPSVKVRRSTAGASNVGMDQGVQEVFARAGFHVGRGPLAPTAPNQEGLYICYGDGASQPPRFAAELALAFKDIGFETRYAPLPPRFEPDEVMIYVGPAPL